MPDVTASYGRSFDSIAFFGYFHTLLTTIDVCSILSSSNFHRLYVYQGEKFHLFHFLMVCTDFFTF